MAIMSKSNRKRHTKPCLYFQTNDCPLSANECDFAHIIATPQQFDSLRNPQSTLRTKPCRFFLGGQCRDGYWCRFKHPANMFATSRMSDSSLLDDVPELDSDKGTDDDIDVRDLDGAYKAKPEEHPKYRTRPCRNYILGKCAYGDRCSYLHVTPPPPVPANSLCHPSVAATRPSPVLCRPITPPPHRVPPTTPIEDQQAESDVDALELDPSAFQTPVRSHFAHEITPSSTSGLSDDSAMPVTPETPLANEYGPFARNNVPPLPLSPLSPLSYMGRRYMAKTRSPLDCMPLSPPLQPPLSMYSPTSPLPLQIVHVPFAVPMYQEVTSPTPTPRRISVSTLKTQSLRSRACSQPEVNVGVNPQDNVPYRAKPCRFFAEKGSCQKGDRCDFIHAYAPPRLHSRSSPTSQNDVTVSNPDSEKKASSESSKLHEPSMDEASEGKSGNFYKINWRVVGGGVKIGTDKTEQRRHSEDSSALNHFRPSFKNPFDSLNARVPVDACSLSPAINLKDRSQIDGKMNNSRKSSLCTKKGTSRDLSLSLALETYSIAKASATPKCSLSPLRARSVVPVLEDNDAESGTLLSVPRQEFARAKSSPSSPVTPLENLPSVIFSAESP